MKGEEDYSPAEAGGWGRRKRNLHAQKRRRKTELHIYTDMQDEFVEMLQRDVAQSAEHGETALRKLITARHVCKYHPWLLYWLIWKEGILSAHCPQGCCCLLSPTAAPFRQEGAFADKDIARAGERRFYDGRVLGAGSERGRREEDGRYHMFASRWSKELGFGNWVTNSQIVRAVSDTPEGPYTFEEVVLPARGKGFFDGYTTHNLRILQYGKQYLLY